MYSPILNGTKEKVFCIYLNGFNCSWIGPIFKSSSKR